MQQPCKIELMFQPADCNRAFHRKEKTFCWLTLLLSRHDSFVKSIKRFLITRGGVTTGSTAKCGKVAGHAIDGQERQNIAKYKELQIPARN
jgi:hypothetical protein